MSEVKLILGDCLTVLKTFAPKSINCVITSPPYYGLRDYGVEGQIGLEQTPDEYVQKLVDVFREIKRVLKDDGTVWLVIGDSYTGGGGAGSEKALIGHMQGNNRASHGMIGKVTKAEGLKPKDLIGIPWRVAFALQADGWYLRSDIIWAKPNPMPESVKDRCTKSHEYIFLLSKSAKYYYDADAITEKSICFNTDHRSKDGPTRGGKSLTNNYAINKGGAYNKNGNRNKRSVWTVSTHPFKGAHFAVFPEELIIPCVLAGCPVGGVILDPFNGAGTTGVVAVKNDRDYIGIDLSPDYIKMSEKRIAKARQQMRLPMIVKDNFEED